MKLYIRATSAAGWFAGAGISIAVVLAAMWVVWEIVKFAVTPFFPGFADLGYWWFVSLWFSAAIVVTLFFPGGRK